MLSRRLTPRVLLLLRPRHRPVAGAAGGRAPAPPPPRPRPPPHAAAASTSPSAAPTFPPPPPGVTRVAVLAGFLGAGKTTTLARLLAGAGEGSGVRVVVNDVGATNVDAAALGAATSLPITPLTAGCACCTLADELAAEVAASAADDDCRWLLVECTGVASPGPVAAAVAAAGPGVDLAAVITVVDASSFAAAVAGEAGKAGRAHASADDPHHAADDAAAVAELLADQVEGADVVLLNKADAATEGEVAAAAAAARALNEGATILTTVRGDAPPSALLASPARGVAGWVAALDAAAEARARAADTAAAASPSSRHHHHHPHAAPAFTTFAYHAARPFHPARLLAALEDDAPWVGVLRSKGFFWLASRPSIAGAWQAAGGGWAGEPSHAWEGDEGGGGAPATDLVFIGGPAMQEARVVAALDGALLTDDEMEDRAGWAALEDELPGWEVEEADD